MCLEIKLSSAVSSHSLPISRHAEHDGRAEGVSETAADLVKSYVLFSGISCMDTLIVHSMQLCTCQIQAFKHMHVLCNKQCAMCCHARCALASHTRARGTTHADFTYACTPRVHTYDSQLCSMHVCMYAQLKYLSTLYCTNANALYVS